jgi:uncharacterized FAD-dependent dehydrogenase
MYKEVSIDVAAHIAADAALYTPILAQAAGVAPSRITHVALLRRSIDARSREVKVLLKAGLYIDEDPVFPEKTALTYQNVANGPEIIIVGAGPAGLFAALRLIELGYKPIIFERGKDVRSRRHDIAAINRQHIVDPNSNYSFGEGGAGTYSDGKLYTRSKKRGNVNRILQVLQDHGADEDILIDAHPHIGTNKLPRIIASIRETIRSCGGEIHFETRVNDLVLQGDTITGIVLHDGRKVLGKSVLLATGHSARDIFEILENRKIQIEAKPFAMGVRVEHPQSLIDGIQYHCQIRSPHLPAAAYSLVKQIADRGVYSFCMCPGGFIVPAATAPGEVVVNGMSPSSRNSQYANSGMVVEIRLEDLGDYHKYGNLASLRYQQDLEKLAWQKGGETQTAPAQRLADFVQGITSSNLPESSYQPGMLSSPLHEWLPEGISKRLREGFLEFGNKMQGYLTNDAVILGVESRTSSPIKIPRDIDTMQHPQIKGLYPCGEGAGYAGGIVSSAMDGERCADAIAIALGVSI